MKIRQVILVLMGMVCSSFCFGQSPEEVSASGPFWDISVASYQAQVQLVDAVWEELLTNEDGVSARGLYSLSKRFWVGVEGGLSHKEYAPFPNTYRHLYYGAVGKWVLRERDDIRTCFIFGGGFSRRTLSYAGNWEHSITRPYAMLGISVELDIGRWGYVGLETQGRYNAHRKLDNFTALSNRWERIFLFRGGIRF